MAETEHCTLKPDAATRQQETFLLHGQINPIANTLIYSEKGVTLIY